MTSETKSKNAAAADRAFEAGQQRAQAVIAIMLLVLAAVFTYGHVTPAPAVGPDSVREIVGDDLTRLDTAIVAADGYGPIGGFIYAVEYALFGANPWGFRFVSIVAHAISAILILLIARRMLPKRNGEMLPLFCGLVFLMCPWSTTAVSALRYQPIVLSVMCILFSAELLFHRNYDGKYYATRPSALSIIAACLAIAIHPVGYAVAPFVLIVDMALRRAQGLAAVFAPHAPIWFVAVAAWLLSATEAPSLIEAMAPMPFYAGGMLWPWNMSIFYPEIDVVRSAAGAILTLVMICLAIGLFRQLPMMAAGVAVIAISLPLLTYVTNSAAAPNEGLAYVGLAGCTIALTGFVALLTNVQPLRPLVAVAAVGFLIVCGIVTFQRNSEYRSPVVLWAEPATRWQEEPVPIAVVGSIHLTTGEAILEQLTLIETASVEDQQAIIDSARESFAEAEAFFERAASLDTTNAKYHFNRAVALFYLEQDVAALIALQNALRVDPYFQEAAIRIGMIHQARADRDDDSVERRNAIDAYRIADETGPLPPDVRRRYAAALNANKQTKEALAVLEGGDWGPNSPAILDMQSLREVIEARETQSQQVAQRLQEDPDNPSVQGSAAQRLIQQGRYLEASYYLEDILRAHPDTASAWILLGVARAGMEQQDVFLLDWPDGPSIPEGDNAWKRLARLCVGEGFTASAEHYLTSDNAVDETPLISLATYAVEANRRDYAADVIERAIAAHPDRYEPWIAKARLAQSIRNAPEAEKALAEAKRLGAPAEALRP